MALHGRDGRPERVSRNVHDLVRFAYDALRGVGAAPLGEWVEVGTVAVHLRRRLSIEEQGAMEVIDVRDTPEAERRFAAVARYLPAGTPLQ